MRETGGTAMVLVAAGLVVAAAAPAPAPAQNQAERLIDAIAACRADSDDKRRLACLDKAADDLIAARQGNAVRIVTPQEAERQKRLEPVETIDSTVTRIALAGRDVFFVTFADKSIWQTTERTQKPIEVGDKIHLRRGALGSYLVSFDGGRSVKVKRIR